MALKIVTPPSKHLLPVTLTCQSCHQQIEASEFSDFTLGTLKRNPNEKARDEIYLNCPLCGEPVFPNQKIKTKLIIAYVVWVSSNQQKWSTIFHCPECKNTSIIWIKNIKVTNTAIGHAGEGWNPRVDILCPICEFDTSAKHRIPTSVQEQLISEALKKYRA